MWFPQRHWLVACKVDFSKYPEEVEYQKFNSKYKLKDRARAVKTTRALNDKVEEQEDKLYKIQLLKNALQKRDLKDKILRSRFEPETVRLALLEIEEAEEVPVEVKPKKVRSLKTIQLLKNALQKRDLKDKILRSRFEPETVRLALLEIEEAEEVPVEVKPKKVRSLKTKVAKIS
jgi:hypothetical protein